MQMQNTNYNSIQRGLRAKSYDAVHFIGGMEEYDDDNSEERCCSCAMCLWEVNDDGMNMRLFEEKKLLADQLANSHQKEEAVIERLVDCQMRLDELQADREADRARINELLEQNSLLEAENMQMERDLSRGAAKVGVRGGGFTGLMRTPGGIKQPPAELFRRIKELELVIENLRTELMEAHKEADRKEERWKFLELQKEKLSIRRELHKVRAELDWTRRRAAGAEQRLAAQARARETAEHSLRQVQRKSLGDPHLANTLQEFTSQVVRLRRKCCKMASKQNGNTAGTGTSNLGEMRAVCKSVHDLSESVNRLSTRAAVNGSSEHLEVTGNYQSQQKQQQQQQYNQNNQQQSSQTSPERRYQHDPMEVMKQKNLQLEIENKKLRKIIEKLRISLVQVDPQYRMKYHYVTSL